MQLNVVINEQEIIDGILNELLKYLRPKFNIAARNSIDPVQNIIRNAIISSNEYAQITPGTKFYHELGIPDIEKRLNKIIAEIEEHVRIDVEFSPLQVLGGQLDGHFTIHVLRKDFDDILGLPEAGFEYYSEKQHIDKNLTWLQWLLFGGSGAIVLGYHFAPVVGKPQSRTGMGLMFKHGSWGVQPVIAGTKSDNFLIRAINSSAYQIIKAVEKEFLILDS